MILFSKGELVGLDPILKVRLFAVYAALLDMLGGFWFRLVMIHFLT